MARLSVCMFGRFSVYDGHRPLAGLEARKLQEFLAYLLLHRDRTFNRETIAELLSPEAAPAQSRKNLRQALWQLQAAVNNAGESAEGRLLLVEADWIAVNAHADLWLDVAEIEAVFARTIGQPGETLEAETASALDRAVGLYHGDLLEGWYQDWCLLERERVQNCYLAMLDKLMAYAQAHGDYERALYYGSSILRCDRARERTHARLMQLYWLAGDRTAALRQFRACAETLREELDVEPSRRTTALYHAILRDAEESAPIAAGQATARPLTAPQPDPRVERVRTCFAELVHLQEAVTRQLTEFQRLLDPEA